MWLQVPGVVESVLWEEPLEPATEEAVERLGQEWAARGLKTDVRDDIRDLPAVSIGQPETWPLTRVYPPENEQSK